MNEIDIHVTSGGKNRDLPLVSVVVITYNSAEFVLETLESIKKQTYFNIELVISDDCSTDNTLEICKTWIANNDVRFSNCRIVENSKNSGVAINCNHGLMAANGEWVKLIAGDDILFPDGIEAYLRFVLFNPCVNVVVSDLEFFGDHTGRFVVDKVINQMSAHSQLRRFVLFGDHLIPSMGPSGFYSKRTMISIGGYNDVFPGIEDYPSTLRLLDDGVKIYALNHVCVGYRIHKGSISTNERFSSKFFAMYEACVVPVLKKRKMYFALYHFYISKILIIDHSNLTKLTLMRYIIKATSPYAWLQYFRRSFCCKGKSAKGSPMTT